MRVQIPINGITTTSEYKDGDCFSLVNLRQKNGALHPVTPRKTEIELYEYDMVFIHKGGDYENWIGIWFIHGFSIYSWTADNPKPKLIEIFANDKTINITGIEQIGNTVLLVADKFIYYLLYKDGNYIPLGNIPDTPVIYPSHHSSNVGSRSYTESYGSSITNPDNFKERTKGLLNEVIELMDPAEWLFDAHFIRYAFRLYDGSLTRQSSPILVMPPVDILKLKTINYTAIYTSQQPKQLDSSSKVNVRGYRVELGYYKDAEIENWRDIIKSVDIFISQPLGISSVEEIIDSVKMGHGDSGSDMPLIEKITEEMMEQVKSESEFRLLKTIDLENIKAGKNVSVIIPDKKIDRDKFINIKSQEIMICGDFSNHDYGSNGSYLYNGRLHLAGINTNFYKGHNIRHFEYRSDAQFYYNGKKYLDFAYYQATYIEVEIRSGGTLLKTVSYTNTSANQVGAFLSYPDARAIRMSIYVRNYDSNKIEKIFTASLKPHEFIPNLSYYIDPDLNPLRKNISEEPIDIPQGFDLKRAIESEPNKLKVSEPNNPFVFPNKNTYTVGNGEILAMASNAQRMSEGQFGQYPLYIFTTQGVYSLNVGEGEVAYSNVSAPTSYECPTTPIVCSTPLGVVFTTARGICIIRGQEVVLLTPSLQQPPQKLNIIHNERESQVIDGVLLNYQQKPFAEYLKGIEIIVYNPHENELIICDKDSPFSYVVCLDNYSIYQSTERFNKVVGNTYPGLKVIDGRKIKDYSLPETNEAHVSFITRPLLFGSTDIKRLERIILRATIFNAKGPAGKLPVVLNYYSNDAVNFALLRGIPFKANSYKDLDMGLFARSKHRQFIFAFAGIIDENSQIQYLDTEVEKEYNNTKMR